MAGRDPYDGGKPTKKTKKPVTEEEGAATWVPCPLCTKGSVPVEIHIAFVDKCREIKEEA